MKSYFFILLTITIAAVSFTSCGDSKKDTPDTLEGVYYDERTTDRDYFEKVANTVLGHIHPSDQNQAVRALHRFVDYCERYEFPEQFHPASAPSRAAQDLADCIECCDFAGLSRALTTYAYSFAGLKGLYQAMPDDNAWRYIEPREDLDFKFFNGTTEYNLIFTGLGGAWSTSVDVNGDNYRFEVPKTIDITLTTGSNTSSGASTQLITAKIITDYQEGSSMRINQSIRFGNIQVESVINSTNNQLANDMTVYVHNTSTMVRTVLCIANTTINGSNLCSINSWRTALTSSDPDRAIGNMFSNATITFNLYKSVQIKANFNNIATLIENADGYWSSSDTADPKGAAEAAADALQRSTTSELRYCSDTNQKLRGSLGWEAFRYDDDYYGEEWGVRPTLKFTSDGSTYDFESFFGNNRFVAVENTLRKIVDAYVSYWK